MVTPTAATAPTPVATPPLAGDKPAYYPEYIYGLHEPGGEHLMLDAGRPGWVLALASVGLDGGSDRSDFAALASAGLGVVVRLHNGYEPAGCLPKPEFYPQFAQACATFVDRSLGCHVWIIGNEPNHAAERPQGEFIFPRQYADAYRRCRTAIKARSGHEHDQVLVAGPALWNAETRYPENPSGDWAKYFGDTLAAIPADECDGFAIHTYTRFHDPSKIKVDISFNADGYRHLHDEFRSYRDLMAQIPAHFRHLPVLITESDPTTWGTGWADGPNNRWVRKAYEEIADWNSDRNHQPIQALLLYRWPLTDQHWWAISTRPGVIADFTDALRSESPERYRIRMPAATPVALTPIAPSLPAPIPLIFTNQDLINAFASAAGRLGLSQWALLEKAGFDVNLLALDRNGRFSGPAIEQMLNLAASERTLLRRALLSWLLEKSTRVGSVNAQNGVNLRSGPSTESTVITRLPHETMVQILGQVNDWLFVMTQGEAGYLRQDLVVESSKTAPVQPAISSLTTVQPIVAPPGASWQMLTVINAWNRFGDQIVTWATSLGIDPGVAVAVLAAESGGATHSPDGRMIIRFENHIFFQEWGQEHQEQFHQHFRFDPTTPWQGHQWNPGDGNWRAVHTNNQSSEWAAFDFARALDERAAMSAISMGAPQIMGFNHEDIGYSTVQAMFQAFQSDPRSQIQGFFDFVRAKGAVEAMRDQNFFEFAKLYNGAGQAADYETIIRNRLALFQSLRPASPGPPPAALPAFEVATPSEVAADRLAAWQQQLLFVTQLSIIQQTYWLRLAAAADPATAQQLMLNAANEALGQLAALDSQRQAIVNEP
jgi:hypothetical protein